MSAPPGGCRGQIWSVQPIVDAGTRDPEFSGRLGLGVSVGHVGQHLFAEVEAVAHVSTKSATP